MVPEKGLKNRPKPFVLALFENREIFLWSQKGTVGKNVSIIGPVILCHWDRFWGAAERKDKFLRVVSRFRFKEVFWKMPCLLGFPHTFKAYFTDGGPLQKEVNSDTISPVAEG